MNIECFKYFYDVATLKSISKVAANSHISQSALSQQIQKLEDKLEVKLLERSNKGVELTVEGHIVLKHCETIVSSYKKMIEDVSSLKLYNNNINIDAYWPVASYATPLLMHNLKKRFADYDLKLSLNNNETIETNLKNDISDIGIVYGDPVEKNLIYSKLGTDRLALVAPIAMKIEDSISIKTLKDYPFILLNDNLNIKHSIYSMLSKIDMNLKDLNISFTVDSIEAAKVSVEKGFGISILPYLSVKNELQKETLKEIELSELNFQYNIYMVYKNETLRNLRTFIEFFKKYMRKVIN